MVHRVCAPPVAIWRERQHADNTPGPIIHGATPEEGAVAAIMLDHEEPHEETAAGIARMRTNP